MRARGGLFLLVSLLAARQQLVRSAQPAQQRAAAYNPFPFHHDPAAATAYALLLAGYKAELYDVGDDMNNVTAAWLPEGVRDARQFDPCSFALIVFVTVDASLTAPPAPNASVVAAAARACPVPRPLLVAIVHDAPGTVADNIHGGWDPNAATTYDAFLALSPHTADVLRRLPLLLGKRVEPLLALFPAPHAGCSEVGRAGVAIQGNVQAARRNFSQIVAEVTRWRGPRYAVTVVGHGAGRVNEQAGLTRQFWRRVTPLADLPFEPFFATLGRAAALLTEFGAEEYYDFKVSSSLGASLISCTPLVVTKRVLRHFSCLPPSAVWLQAPGEGPFDALQRHGWLAGLPSRLAALDDVRMRAYVENAAAIRRIVAVGVPDDTTAGEQRVRRQSARGGGADAPPGGKSLWWTWQHSLWGTAAGHASRVAGTVPGPDAPTETD